MSGDRGQSVAAMAEAFARWIEREPRIGGIISAGGSGGTTLATAGMRVLPVGIPKIMVSTVAAGDVAQICRRRRHHDVPFRRRRAGAELDHRGRCSATPRMRWPAWSRSCPLPRRARRNAGLRGRRIGITMFGVTTPAVQAVTKRLEADYDCLVFHATGIGGRSMENLGDSGCCPASST